MESLSGGSDESNLVQNAIKNMIIERDFILYNMSLITLERID